MLAGVTIASSGYVYQYIASLVHDLAVKALGYRSVGCLSILSLGIIHSKILVIALRNLPRSTATEMKIKTKSRIASLAFSCVALMQPSPTVKRLVFNCFNYAFGEAIIGIVIRNIIGT